MAKSKLSDRRLTLFGRHADVDYLIRRAESKGLTAVVARPQMGKTWLFTHVGWLLSQQGSLVGYEESVGQGTDLMLRAVADLYTLWLNNASYRDQAKSLLHRHKDELLTSAGRAFGKIVEPLSKTVGLEALGKPISEIFEALACGDTDLRSGGASLPKLDYEKARELVELVAKFSKKPIALFLDAWEKSSVEVEYTTLDGFLSHLDDWPACHIFLGLRPKDPALKKVKELMVASPEVELYELPQITLDDHGVRYSFLQHIRAELQNLKSVTDDELLGLVGGFPGVISRWLSPSHRLKMTGFSDLQKVAEAAQQYRYYEFDQLLGSCSTNECKLALRLALLPHLDEDAWTPYKEILLEDIDYQDLLSLRDKKVLEEDYAYGHETRHLAAKRWFLKNRPAQTKNESRALMFSLARRVDNFEPSTLPLAAALARFVPLADELELNDLVLSLGVAALSQFPDIEVNTDLLLSAGRLVVDEEPRVAPLISIGLLNCMWRAKNQNAFQRRDELLTQLRQLYQARPQASAVRQQLAHGLFNTLNDAKTEKNLQRRDQLLTELRQLHQAWPDDPAVLKVLAHGLVNTFNDAKAENNRQRRHELLTELRQLHQTWPDDPHVREGLARVLANTVDDAEAENDPQHRDHLLSELRQLHQAWPQDSSVRAEFAHSLFNTLVYAKTGNNLQLRDDLLTEVRQLHQAWPQDSSVRAELAQSLLNTLIYTKAEGDLQRPDDLVNELRQLHQAWPQDPAVREGLARGLFNALMFAQTDGDFHRRNDLLNELRWLHQASPQDAATRGGLARGLSNMLMFAQADGDLQRRNDLLNELRQLHQAWPQDPVVTELLAAIL